MGQYYCGAILNKDVNETKEVIIKQAFCTSAHNCGAKLMEHSYVGVWYIKEYEHALATDFYNHPFVWSGDYADEHLGTDIYSAAYSFIEKMTDKNAEERGYEKNPNGSWGCEYIRNGIAVSEREFIPKTKSEKLPTYKYIINFTKKIFVCIPEKPDNGWVIHPLPLLCADGNGRGGGDYEGTNMELIGSWAFDNIGVADEIPDEIETELIVEFKECYEGGDSSVNDFQFIPHK